MGQALCNASQFDAFMAKLLRRYAFVNHLNIGAFAEAFAGHLRISEIPRDPFLLLPGLGIKLERRLLSRASRAVWVRTNDCYHIHFSQYESRPSIRFSLWHETFEILAQQPRFPSQLNDEWRERLADRFAANLLMPETAIRRQAKKFATNGEGLTAVLAHHFGVSRTAMQRRLRELSLVPPLFMSPNPGLRRRSCAFAE